MQTRDIASEAAEREALAAAIGHGAHVDAWLGGGCAAVRIPTLKGFDLLANSEGDEVLVSFEELQHEAEETDDAELDEASCDVLFRCVIRRHLGDTAADAGAKIARMLERIGLLPKIEWGESNAIAGAILDRSSLSASVEPTDPDNVAAIGLFPGDARPFVWAVLVDDERVVAGGYAYTMAEGKGNAERAIMSRLSEDGEVA